MIYKCYFPRMIYHFLLTVHSWYGFIIHAGRYQHPNVLGAIHQPRVSFYDYGRRRKFRTFLCRSGGACYPMCVSTQSSGHLLYVDVCPGCKLLLEVQPHFCIFGKVYPYALGKDGSVPLPSVVPLSNCVMQE